MSEFLMGFDVLALGALLGALLLFGAVIWVLVDNRPTPSGGDGRGGRAA
ncbi:MAG: hypothetical protein KY466_15885 [Gemmatimonadetes bacterium]|nr:hypothetical protein [Gemmatimonadota bacterium]